MKLKTTFLFIILFAACTGEPLPPEDPQWIKIADFPPNIKKVGSIKYNGTIIRAVANDTNLNKYVVVSYENSVFATEFVMPGEFSRGWFADYSFLYRGGCVVGGIIEGGKTRPLFIDYNDQQTWKEANLNGLPDGTLSTIVYTGTDLSWLLLDESWYPGDHDGFLVKYFNNSAHLYQEFGPITAVYVDSGYLSHTIIAASYVPKGRTTEGDIKIYISSDGGASWLIEPLPARLVKGREIVAAEARGHFGGHVYFPVRFADGAIGIIKREGPPGRGVYEPVFVGYAGPYFQDIDSIGFRDSHSEPYGISVDGVAVGLETTLVFDEGLVYLEKIPYPLELSSVIPADGNGFFSVGRDLTFRDYDLLYHP
jgi:hypothetical protein